MNKKVFVYRNYTLENLFPKDTLFSGYDDISFVDKEADIYIWFYLLPAKSNTDILLDEIVHIYEKLDLIKNNISSNKLLLLFTIEDFYSLRFFNADFRILRKIEEYNQKLFEMAEKYKNVKIIDFSEFVNKHRAEIIDWKYYYISQMIINPKLSDEFKKWLDHKINSIYSIRKKCIVLDLDNTLWGGILGEDGIYGIQIGNSYPGNSFTDFQKSLLEISKKGIILSICSKNNENDVLELWKKNQNIILKKEHFSAYRINWNDKASNIIDIAKELNIGLDSLVFIDDNPGERELVKKMIPEISVPEFPKYPYELRQFWEKLYEEYFQIYNLTDEDLQKTKQYMDNFKRNEFRKKFVDIEDYLRNLKIVITVAEANISNITRISQMTQKTNQFNLTTKRYTEQDISALLENSYDIFCFSISDKYGDNGITSTIFVEFNNSDFSARIDTFLLSCRILGKGIENTILTHILNYYYDKGVKSVYAEYIPTLKNVQVKNFYDNFGFELVNEQNSKKDYKLNLKGKLEIKDYYEIKEFEYER